jgi:hypothetical protein
MRRIIKTWWPLAASWLLMSVSQPVMSAVIARLASPEVNLAAYGGVVHPISLIIESPIIMLLAASTALSKDWVSYLKVQRFTYVTAGILTLIHILVAFTPLYYVVVRQLLGVPEEIIEPARLGLMCMTPWTPAIAQRRFQQGAMIRFGHSEAVVVGTVIRLATFLTVLGIGYSIQSVPGVVVGSAAQALSVTAESAYVGIRVRPVLKEIRVAPPVDTLTWKKFAVFYIPLALTSLMTFLWQPLASAGLSRMPNALDSLAVWPVVYGLSFMLRSFGTAYNEVVVALLDEPRSQASLRRFTTGLALSTTTIQLLMVSTPIAYLWFNRLSALSGPLSEVAVTGLWILLPLPALTALQSWYQGAIMHGSDTRGISESVAIFLGTAFVVLAAGVIFGRWTGLYYGALAYLLASLAQTGWQWLRSRQAMRLALSE